AGLVQRDFPLGGASILAVKFAACIAALKLIWRTPLPSALELYNIAQDPGENTNLAEKNPEMVAKLQKRIDELARESAKSLFLVDAFTAVKAAAHGAPALPSDEAFFTQGD